MEGDEEVLPEFTLEARVELHTLTANVAQARIILNAQIDVRSRPVICIERRLEEQERLDVLRRLHVDSAFVVEREPGADAHLRTVAVDQPRPGRPAHLRPQLESEALVGFKAAGGCEEPPPPRVA